MRANYKVLKGGTVINGAGGAPIENGALVFKDDRIEAVGSADMITIPEGAEVIEITGKTVMPGLIDAHVHLYGFKTFNAWAILSESAKLRAIRASLDAWKVIDCGFTTIRDCGSSHNLSIKKAVEEGSIIGPRILGCGPALINTPGIPYEFYPVPIDWVVETGIFSVPADGADECRKLVRERVREGVDFIKTMDLFSSVEIKAIVEEAHDLGVKVAIHVWPGQTIKKVISAGPDTIEHAPYLDDDDIEMMLEKGTYLIPTLAVMDAWERKGHPFDLDETMRQLFRDTYKAHLISFEKAWKAGVKIGVGCDYLSDSLTPMGENAIELELQVKLGRSPMETIVSATKVNAEALGIDDRLGTLEVGKLADIIVVNGDPLKDISVLRDKANIVKI